MTHIASDTISQAAIDAQIHTLIRCGVTTERFAAIFGSYQVKTAGDEKSGRKSCLLSEKCPQAMRDRSTTWSDRDSTSRSTKILRSRGGRLPPSDGYVAINGERASCGKSDRGQRSGFDRVEPERLGAEEEADLCRKAKEGCTDARRRILESCLRWIRYIATHEFSNQALSEQLLSARDLEHEGVLGVYRAIEGFDPDRGTRFLTYAYPWVRFYISTAIAKQRRTVSLSVHLSRKVRNVLITRDRLVGELAREPNSDEVAAATGNSVKEVENLSIHAFPPLSWDALDGEGARLQDSVPDPQSLEAGERLDRQERAACLDMLLKDRSVIGARDAHILELYFGLNDAQPMNAAAIGRRLGVSRQRILQVQQRALRVLREALLKMDSLAFGNGSPTREVIARDECPTPAASRSEHTNGALAAPQAAVSTPVIASNADAEKPADSNSGDVAERLSRDEERELLRKAKAGCQVSQQRIVESSMRLVSAIASKEFPFHGRTEVTSLNDLIHEGVLGVYKAMEGFDPSHGTRFCTYSFRWIRLYIRNAITKHQRTIQLPTQAAQRVRRIAITASILESQLGRRPSPAEVAQEMNTSLRCIDNVRQHAARPLSWNTQVNDHEVLEDVVADPHSADIEQHRYSTERIECLRQVLYDSEVMTPRETEILEWHFGIGGKETLSLEAIGQRFGVTRERIRQVQGRAMEKMRQALVTLDKLEFVDGCS